MKLSNSSASSPASVESITSSAVDRFAPKSGAESGGRALEKSINSSAEVVGNAESSESPGMDESATAVGLMGNPLAASPEESWDKIEESGTLFAGTAAEKSEKVGSPGGVRGRFRTAVIPVEEVTRDWCVAVSLRSLAVASF